MRLPSKPSCNWDCSESDHLVWVSRLDRRYLVEVRRTGPRTGELFMFDMLQDQEQVFRVATNLAFGAPVGPDVADVARWEFTCLEVADRLGRGVGTMPVMQGPAKGEVNHVAFAGHNDDGVVVGLSDAVEGETYYRPTNL